MYQICLQKGGVVRPPPPPTYAPGEGSKQPEKNAGMFSGHGLFTLQTV